MNYIDIENYQDTLAILSDRADCVTVSMPIPQFDFDLLQTQVEKKQQYLNDKTKCSQEDFINFENFKRELFKTIKQYRRYILFTQLTKNYGPIIYNQYRLIIGFRFSRKIFKLLNGMTSFFSSNDNIFKDVMFYEKGVCLLAGCASEGKLFIYDDFLYTFTNLKSIAIKLFNQKVTYQYPYKLNNDGNVILSSKRGRKNLVNKNKMHV